MANKKKGQLTVSGEWARHLRKFLRRHFWKGERVAGKKLIRRELLDKGKNGTGNAVHPVE